MVDVFISYAAQDHDRVLPIIAALESKGWNVCRSRANESGSSIDREIEASLDTAECVIVVWSPKSAKSDWVRTRASEGLQRDILVALAIDGAQPPLAFRRTPAIEIHDGQSDTSTTYRRGIDTW